MDDFFKCCFPGARKPSTDDETELVSTAALSDARARLHNAHLPHIKMVPARASSAHHNPYRRRPSEDLQDLVDNETQQDKINDVPFNAFDRAHAHLLRDLNSALEHFQYAVSGSYAEALWGCQRGKRRNIVSIMCQSSSRKTIRVWLCSQTLFTISANDENVLEYQGDVKGAEPLSVRIRWVSDRGLQCLRIIESKMRYREGPLEPVNDVRLVLLTLPALADSIAWSFINARDQRAREDFATDLFSVLQRIVDLGFAHEGTGPLSAEENVHLLSKEFWIPFTEAYPHALEFFARCGAPFPDFAVVASQPQAELDLQMRPSALRPNNLQKPRSAPFPPLDQESRHTTLSSSLKQASSSRHKKSSSSSTTKRSSADREKTQHFSPEPSPQRPVHPANIIHPQPELRFKFSAFFGLKESPETLERRKQEKLENDRAARRASEKLAAKIQRNRERDREREWHTRKQSERMGIHEPLKNPMFMPQSQMSGTAEAGSSRARMRARELGQDRNYVNMLRLT